MSSGRIVALLIAVGCGAEAEQNLDVPPDQIYLEAIRADVQDVSHFFYILQGN